MQCNRHDLSYKSLSKIKLNEKSCVTHECQKIGIGYIYVNPREVGKLRQNSSPAPTGVLNCLFTSAIRILCTKQNFAEHVFNFRNE